MGKKIEKIEEVILELKRRRKRNDEYCYVNSCSPTPYMDGSNKILDDIIEYIENLK